MQYKDLQLFFVSRNYARSTEDIYSRMIMDALDTLGDLESVTPLKFRKWLDREEWGSSTRWLAYSAVREYIKWKWGKDHPALELSINRKDPGPQRTLSIQQAKMLDKYLNSRSGNKGVRDLAIYSVLMDTGLRSSELCSLDRDKIDLDNRTLTVQVKGGDWGAAIFSEITALRIIDWLQVRIDHANGSKAVFVGIKGSKPGTRITPSGLRVIVRRWGERAEIGPLSPHDFRRSFATISTILHAPPRMVQMAGRWSRIKEVERYTRGLQLTEFEDYLPMKEITRD